MGSTNLWSGLYPLFPPGRVPLPRVKRHWKPNPKTARAKPVNHQVPLFHLSLGHPSIRNRLLFPCYSGDLFQPTQ